MRRVAELEVDADEPLLVDNGQELRASRLLDAMCRAGHLVSEPAHEAANHSAVNARG